MPICPPVAHLTAVLLAACAIGLTAPAQAATALASYSFNGNLLASEAGAPALLAIDPLAANGFETAVVHGVPQQVYRWSGDGSASSQQGGLTLDASGLASASSYTLTFTFEFLANASTGGGWRRLVDTEGRQSDNGLYLAPGAQLSLVQQAETANPQIVNGSTLFTTPGFHDVLLSVANAGNGQQQVLGWLDGQLQFSVATATTFTLANAGNPQRLITLFADNLAAGSQLEYANGRIAALALYDGVLTPSAVPELPPAALLAAGMLALGWRLRRLPTRR
jgi:hypothetical protein